MRVGGIVCVGGGCSEARSLRKGPLSASPGFPPWRGPDRYKLGAIKLSPCHLCRIQSRIERGGEKEREGEKKRGRERER